MESGENKKSCVCCEGTRFKDVPAQKGNRVETLLECLNCGVVRMEGSPPSLPMNAPATSPILESFSSPMQWLKEQLLLKPEIRSLRRRMGSNGPVLDVGCGNGWATALWRDYGGVEVHGIEFQPERAELARKRFGLNIFSGTFEDLPLPAETYELVIMRHVFEHFHDPVRILKQLNKILRPGGLVIMILPNAQSLGRLIFGRYWAWGIPAHFFTFTPRSLECFLQRMDFIPGPVQFSPSPILLTTSLNNWMRGRGWSRLADLFTDGNLFLNSLFFPLALVGKVLGRSEVMGILAEKKGSS
ncbi:MAG TPA: methyltransferase domain-containing protein [Nitrospiria bacterium]|nr:methyltransferase domain-containing protein [Nitrospiria bacterium]